MFPSLARRCTTKRKGIVFQPVLGFKLQSVLVARQHIDPQEATFLSIGLPVMATPPIHHKRALDRQGNTVARDDTLSTAGGTHDKGTGQYFMPRWLIGARKTGQEQLGRCLA